MIGRIAATAVIGLLLTGQAALAAENARLGAVSGSVMVNQAGRLAPASQGAVLRTGDRVIASNGSARLIYADGCNVAVSARSMATVSAASPCAGGSSNVVKVSTRTDGGGDGSIGYGEDWDFWLWATFGVVTTVAVGTTMQDDSDPNSP